MKNLLTFCLLTLSISIFSQSNEDSFLSKVRFGGGFGFSFGSNNTSISVSPTAVYDFNEEFSIGATLGYLYNKRGDFNANVYSASVLTLYRPIRQIEFSAELMQSYVDRSFGTTNDTYSYPSLNVGAAYITGKVTFGVQYDLLYDETKSVNANGFTPFIRVLF